MASLLVRFAGYKLIEASMEGTLTAECQSYEKQNIWTILLNQYYTALQSLLKLATKTASAISGINFN